MYSDELMFIIDFADPVLERLGSQYLFAIQGVDGRIIAFCFYHNDIFQGNKVSDVALRDRN